MARLVMIKLALRVNFTYGKASFALHLSSHFMVLSMIKKVSLALFAQSGVEGNVVTTPGGFSQLKTQYE